MILIKPQDLILERDINRHVPLEVFYDLPPHTSDASAGPLHLTNLITRTPAVTACQVPNKDPKNAMFNTQTSSQLWSTLDEITVLAYLSNLDGPNH